MFLRWLLWLLVFWWALRLARRLARVAAARRPVTGGRAGPGPHARTGPPPSREEISDADFEEIPPPRD